MELIHTLSDAEEQEAKNYKVREACRAVLFDENKKIPILYVAKHNIYKLPGGGIDEGESKEEALKRECLEESGCEIEILKEIGEFIELRKEHELKQISYNYIGKVLSKGEVSFTEKERNYGFELHWLDLDDAIKKMRSIEAEKYSAKFMQERDLIILEKAKSLI